MSETMCVLPPVQGKESQLDEKWRLPRRGKNFSYLETVSEHLSKHLPVSNAMTLQLKTKNK